MNLWNMRSIQPPKKPWTAPAAMPTTVEKKVTIKAKNTDSRKVFDESRNLIRKWKDELKSRKWLVNKVSKKIDISNKGAIRYQNRNGKKKIF